MEALDNFLIGLLFIGGIVGGGLLGSAVSGGSWLAIMGLGFVGLIVGSALAYGSHRLMTRLASRPRPVRRRAGTAASAASGKLKAFATGCGQMFLLIMIAGLLAAVVRDGIVDNNLLATILGVVLSIIPWSLAFILVLKTVIMRRSDPVVQAVVGCVLGILCVGGLFTWFYTSLERKPVLRAAYWEAIAPACDGQGIYGAEPYGQPSSVRHIVALRGGKQEWYSEMPAEWLPDSVATTQLVACVSERERYTIEVCRYTGSDVTRYGYRREVTLVSAETGEEIASETFTGKPPRACQGTERVSLTKLTGKDVTFGAVSDWLSRYVEP